MSLRNIQVIPGLPFDVKPFIDITDKLACRTPDPEPRRTIEDITHASVHHSAVEGATIESYANHHVNTLKWYHIGYHNVIKGDQLYQTNDWLTKSYHTSGQNGYTVSFSISGDLSKRPMSELERNNLYAGLLTALSIFPNLTMDNILGHNEFPDQNTACPCIDMKRVREDVRTLDMKLKQQDTWATKLEKVGELANQYNYMWSKIQLGESDGDAQWALNKLLDVHDIMKSQGLL